MRLLVAPTEDFIKQERGSVASDATAGSSVTITLESNQGFAANDFVAIGYEGNELCELAQIASLSGNTGIVVSTLKFNHKAGEPVTMYRFNQRKFYGATSADGVYTELTGDGSPKTISVDDPQGTLLEYTGSDYTYFKATYYNSTSATETAIADSEAVLADESLRFASIYGIRKMAGLAGNPYYSDMRIEQKRRQAENEVASAIYGRYSLPLGEVPPVIQQVTELLAAGYIDFEEFGSEGEGVKWLGEARAILGQIAKGSRLLIGADGVELATVTKTNVLSGYPDSTIDEGSDEDFKFKINQKF